MSVRSTLSVLSALSASTAQFVLCCPCYPNGMLYPCNLRVARCLYHKHQPHLQFCMYGKDCARDFGRPCLFAMLVGGKKCTACAVIVFSVEHAFYNVLVNPSVHDMFLFRATVVGFSICILRPVYTVSFIFPVITLGVFCDHLAFQAGHR